MMRLHQAELMILIWGSKGEENRQNDNLVQKILLGNVIASRNHHKKDLMMVTSKSITFGSPVANSYAQSSNITSGTPNNDVNSDLIASNSH
jgi:hypothetical protein